MGPKAPVELSVFMYEDSDPNTLVYFDPQGRRYQQTVEHSLIDEALMKVNGGPKAIPRSTGGIVAATPYDLIMYQSIKESTPEIRIRVKFKDFLAMTTDEQMVWNYVVHTKDILPHELVGGFRHEIGQNYLVDFGQGVVPVQVFDFAKNYRGETLALFVEHNFIKKAVHGKSGELLAVQSFGICPEVLRFAQKVDLERAKRNYHEIQSGGGDPIPAVLKNGFPLQIALGADITKIWDFMRQYLKNRSKSTESDELLRFMTGI